MFDQFAKVSSGISGPGTRHFSINPADADLPVRPRAMFVLADGDLVIRDEAGSDVTYAVTAGAIIPFRAVQVRAATTATVVGWY
jgi:hypothetical protein